MTSSYLTLEPGTPVSDRFGQHVGTIKRVLIADADYFDGVIVTCPAGDRFVDAPEVRRISDGEVELAVALSDVEHPGPKGPPGPRDVHGIRRDRLEASDQDRAVAVTQLKIAFVDDEIGVDELERRVERAHQSAMLRDLDALLADLD